jgi:L-tartrate/succinate antiporter
MQWFISFAPVGVLLLALVPLLTYYLYPPELKSGGEVPAWAAQALGKMGRLTRKELILAILVFIALALWIFGSAFLHPTTAVLLVLSLMLLTRVLTWNDILHHTAAWNTLVWFATLVTLADGLNKVGFVGWFADFIATYLSAFSPFSAMILLVLVFYFSHYFFASITAHVTALMPVMLAIGATVPGMNLAQFALLMSLTLGIMGIQTPYASGPSSVYYGSGFLPSADFWRLGAIFGVIFIAVLLLIGLPWILMLG